MGEWLVKAKATVDRWKEKAAEARANVEDARADLAGLIEQEDGEEWGENLKNKLKKKKDDFVAKAKGRFDRAQAKREKIERNLEDAKAKVDDAKDQVPEWLVKAKATVDRLKEQAAEARATVEDARADLAGLIEQEDGEEWKKRKEKAKKLKKKKDDFVAKAKGRFNEAKAKKEKIERKLKDAKAKLDEAKDKGGEWLVKAKAT